MDETVNTSGFDAIESAMLSLYPTQTNPLHYATMINWSLGGNDPLDGVSIYETDDFYHFVTFGFSELYEKESKNLEYSGFGFELTLKLQKSPDVDEFELKNMVGVLQGLARYIFADGAVFSPYEYIYTGQKNGIDQHGKSKLTGFFTLPSSLGVLNTPNGKVEFVELLGMTNHELLQAYEKKATRAEIEALVHQYNLQNVYTNLSRDDLF